MTRQSINCREDSDSGLDDHNSGLGNRASIDNENLKKPKTKLQSDKERKARNQHRYCQNHRESQQEKARQRSVKNGLLAKQHLWHPSSEDGYGNACDVQMPSLVPVFDPTFMASSTLPSIVALFNSFVLPTPSSSFRNNENGIYTATLFSLPFSDFDGDMNALGFLDWKSLTASRRIAAVRRWIIHATRRYGPVERWGEDLSQEWDMVRHRDPPIVSEWIQAVKSRVKVGHSALSYLECAMEGELSSNMEEWRDLYIQSHQLASQLWGAVLRIQHRLDGVLSGKGPL